VDFVNIIEANNIATRDLVITGALKFENYHFTVTATKEINEFMSDVFFCDPLEDKVVLISFGIEGLFVLRLRLGL
jgi:hypothetical protein